MTPLTVFVCSTYSDLSEEREAVLDAIRRLQLQHDSMEFFGARSDVPIETCLSEVRRSNMLVVIVGHRYGTMVPNRDVSFSEAEYSEAHRLRKPCLVYMRSDDVPVLPKHIERDPEKLRLLENWKSTLQSRHTVAPFRESHDLAVQVAADIGRTIHEIGEASKTREEARADSPTIVLEEVTELIARAVAEGASESSLLSSIRHAIAATTAAARNLGPMVFFSYANADRTVVRKVAAALSANGIDVWFDETSLKAGKNWVREIERGLDTADFVTFFMSRESVNSRWPQKELQIALHRQVSGEGGAVILPVLLEQTEVPPLLRDIQWIDMTDGDVEGGTAKLINAIQHYSRSQAPDVERVKVAGKRIARDKVVAVLEEERGVVGAAAKRLGLSSKRLYQLLRQYNIQARGFR